MISRLATFIDEFRREEDAQIVIEFMVMFPLIFTLFMTSVEMGIYSFRQVFLDRGLDMAVREIRLSTGEIHTHDEIKERVCAYAGFLDNCDQTLRLEMTPINVRGFSGLAEEADCIDLSATPEPPRLFAPGSDHQLMVLRACVKIDPVFPTTGLGRHFAKDGAGKVQMIATSAFVQEPQ
ncbi:TadE family protein [Sulfitobacter sp. LCG007]